MSTPESFDDQLARVLHMAHDANGETWDLSAKDRAALLAVLASHARLVNAAKHAVMEYRLHGQLTDSCRVLDAEVATAEGR
jgi:hypothetical protein